LGLITLNDQNKQKLAGIFTAPNEIDVAEASISADLSKVWSDDEHGSIAISMDRIVFDDLTEVASRYLEPNGFSLNLENILSVIDSMRIGVFASLTSKSGELQKAKMVMPMLFMQLPKHKSVGKVLKKFYEEVTRYESELTRLQDAELRAQKNADLAIKDDNARKIVENLRIENLSLRSDLERLQKKLLDFENFIKSNATPAYNNEMPTGTRQCVVRSVRVQEGIVLLKAGESQFTFPLKLLDGTPEVGSKALAVYEGGVPRHVWIYSPRPHPFNPKFAQVMSVDSNKVKIKFANRRERIVALSPDQAIPPKGSFILGLFSGDFLVSLTSIELDNGGKIADLVFDEQTKIQIKDSVEQEVS
jgi:hypothetical protein